MSHDTRTASDTRVDALAVIGPTASGKSALALQLAQHLPVELVSVDSAQVYRGMDIGTAKPSSVEQASVPHHLIDLVDPDQAYSAGRFVRDAVAAVAAIRARGRIPLLVGGTMLYVRSLLQGIAELPQADASLRARIDALIAERGVAEAHAELGRRDPAAAARIRPADRQRIQRGLELIELTGQPLAELYARHARPPALRAAVLALLPSDRAALYDAIDARFAGMLQAGLVDELRDLRQRFDLRSELPSMRAVGYRQAWAFLQGEIDAEGLLRQGQAASRHLAKRQLTWLRSLPVDTVLGGAPSQALQPALAWARATCKRLAPD